MTKKKTIILECDSFSIVKLKNWLDKASQNENFIFFILTQTERFSLFQNELLDFKNVKCITYDDIFNYDSNFQSISASEYYDFNGFYLNDDITSRLLDRDGYLPKYGLGIQHGLGYYSGKALNTLNFLKENNILFIYFRNTPHHSVEWLLAKAADFLNIDIFTTERHVLPWLFSISKGYLKSRELMFKDITLEPLHELEFHIDKFIKNTSKDYESAIPVYEKERLSIGIFKYYNPFKNFKNKIVRPHIFYTITKNFFYYKKISQDLNILKTSYIIFFLHYQPERTTLPEGYDFTDQLFAIRTLRLLLPENVKLLVKEHPSMFTNKSEPKARNSFFYKSINDIKGVSFVNIAVNSFQLIDNAIAVATITGTVALESYIRKKPAILFGRSNFYIDGVHVFTSINNLTIFLKNLFQGGVNINSINSELLSLCSKAVVSGILGSRQEDIIYHCISEHQENAHYKLLTKLIQEKVYDLQ